MVRQRARALWDECLSVNPGLCIESECRPPEGLPRRERAPADYHRPRARFPETGT